jgi:YVTN family beta-propeller protein
MKTPDDKYLIVANAASNELVFLDPATGAEQRRLKDISDPYQIGFSPDQRWFVSASNRLDRVDLYDGRDFKLVKRFPAPKVPSHIAFDAKSQYAFVTLQESDELLAIDLGKQEIAWKMKVGRQPAGVWMTPDDKHLLVGLTGDKFVEVIDWRTQKSVKKLMTGQGAHNFLPMGDGKRVLLSNRVANTVSVIDQDTLEVVDTIPVPGGPDCMELSKDGSQLWVTSRWARQVTVVDMGAKKIMKTVAVGKSPHGIFLKDHAPRR